MDYRKLHNDELIDLIFTQEDRLPRAVADEIVQRAGELTRDLALIAMDRVLWTADIPDWWAPIHATYLLGAIGTPEVITPLLSALRWSDAYDNEWIAEDLPSIFGATGLIARAPLEAAIAEKSAGWSARAIAMDGLTAIAVHHTAIEEDVVHLLTAILKDTSEEMGARRAAATILLDLRRSDRRKDLVKFARADERMFKEDPMLTGGLSVKEVEDCFAVPARDTEYYLRDWMAFYDADEIRKRQNRWSEEDAKYRVRPQMLGAEGAVGRAQMKKTMEVRLEGVCPCGSGKKFRRCCWQKVH